MAYSRHPGEDIISPNSIDKKYVYKRKYFVKSICIALGVNKPRKTEVHWDFTVYSLIYDMQ